MYVKHLTVTADTAATATFTNKAWKFLVKNFTDDDIDVYFDSDKGETNYTTIAASFGAVIFDNTTETYNAQNTHDTIHILPKASGDVEIIPLWYVN